MATRKPAAKVAPKEEEFDDDLDGLVDDLDMDVMDDDLEGDEDEPEPAPKKSAAKKATRKPAAKVAPKEEEFDDDLEGDEDEPEPAPKKSSDKKSASKKPKPASDEEGVEKRMEGLTKATEESGIIQFAENSGTQGILLLIGKVGFDKDKVLKIATSDSPKFKKFNEKYFSKCDVSKKYAKVAAIINKLVDAGYKLPEN